MDFNVVSTVRLVGPATVVTLLVLELVTFRMNPSVPRTPTVRWCLIPTRALLKGELTLGWVTVVC